MKIKRLALILLLCVVASASVFAFVSGADAPNDAMPAIREALSEYQVGETVKLDTDSYIGIPVELTVYFDSTDGKVATPGYNGTDAVLYVINTRAVRSGTDSDADIIRSMLDRGMIVTVLDYKNHRKAKGADLDWSAQAFIAKMGSGTYYQNTEIIPTGTYYEQFLVPAGCNLSTDHVIWEIDKHSAVGTMERIVWVWNNDFRGVRGDKFIVKWVHEDGTKKATQNGIDGSEPQWFADAEGKIPDPDGEYIKLKHTLALTITDCVKRDGSPMDLNLSMHVVYPTNPEHDVPVMTMACSSEHLASGAVRADRPHLNGFLFEGYAVANYDYAYVPMARNDHYGYFAGDSAGALTGNNANYGIYGFNNTECATSAIRALRYLSLSDHETYSFDIDHIGILGNSKGSGMTFLGDPALNSIVTPTEGEDFDLLLDKKITSILDSNGFANEERVTRYHGGERETYSLDGYTIDGGELQPWLRYGETQIASGVQWVYSSCGSVLQSITEDFAPLFVPAHQYSSEASGYLAQNQLINLARNMDVPTLWFETEWNHNFVPRHERNWGIDPYEQMKAYANYYLRGDSVSVSNVLPSDKLDNVSAKTTVSVKFLGSVERSEAEKITVTSKHGTVSGTWTSLYGNTEWIFTPDHLLPTAEYTVKVPKGLCGDNGVPMASSYVTTFKTEKLSAMAADRTNSNLTSENGTYLSVTVPDYEALGGNAAILRLEVENDAANVLSVYQATSMSEHTDVLVDRIHLRGRGHYDVDLTALFAGKTVGTVVYFYVVAERASGISTVYSNDFSSDMMGSRPGDYCTAELTEVDGRPMYKATLGLNAGAFGAGDVTFGSRSILTNSVLFGDTALTAQDYGRKFTVSVGVYDTIARKLHMSLGTVSNRSADRRDYDRVLLNAVSRPGETVTMSFDYSVYEMDYNVNSVLQTLTLNAYSDAKTQTPVYVDFITVTEEVTDVTLGDVQLCVVRAGDYEYKAPVNVDRPVSVGGVTYPTLTAAIVACTDGATVTLLADYTFTDEEAYALGHLNNITIDLNGYTVNSLAATRSLLYVPPTSYNTTNITLKNGSVLLNRTPLVTYGACTVHDKVVNVSVENVYISLGDNVTTQELIASSTVTHRLTSNITLTDCTLDVPSSKIEKVPYLVIFWGMTKGVSNRYVMNGGEIRLESFRNVDIYRKVTDVNFATDGRAPKITVSNACAVGSEAYLCGGTMMRLVREKVGAYDTTYSLSEDPLYTPYGIIPEEYADEDKYPFVVFDSSFGFQLATDRYAIDSDRGSAMGIATHTNPTDYIVYLRRDYTDTNSSTHWNVGMLNGTWTLDLNGYTLTLSNQVPFKLQAKRSLSTALIYKNGTILVGPKTMIEFSSDGTYAQSFSLRFDNITFGLKDATPPATLIASTGSVGKGAAFTTNLEFNDCTFDLRGLTKSITLFNVGSASGYLNGGYTVNGGTVLVDDPSLLTVSKTVGNDIALLFNKGADGKYTTVSVPVGVELPTFVVTTPEGYMSFFDKLDDVEGRTPYGLVYNDHATVHGLIPNEYFDASAYPFLVFDGLGSFVSAHATLGADSGESAFSACTALIAAGKTPVILARRDFTAPEYTNLATDLAGGSAILDLGGHTVTSSNGSYLFDLKAKKSADVRLTIQNGTARLTDASSFFRLSISGRSAQNFFVTLKDVTVVDAGTSASGLLVTLDPSLSRPVYCYLTVLDCKLDMRSEAKDANKAIVDMNSAKATGSLTLLGGEVLAKNSDSFAFFRGGNVSLEMGEGSTFKHPYLVLDKNASAPLGSFSTVAGLALKYAKHSSDANTTTFALGFDTKYGTVPVEYDNVDLYPFFIFDGEGNFYGYSTYFADDADSKSAIQMIRQLCDQGKTPILLVRKDWTTADKFNNLYSLGSFTIDLDGHTFTGASYTWKPYVFKAQAKHGNCNVTVNVINGTIVVDRDNYLIYCENSLTNNSHTGVFTFNFTDVTIRRVATHSRTDGFLWNIASGATGKLQLNVTFNNCIFDYLGLTEELPIVLFGQNAATQIVHAEFIGGQLIGAHIAAQRFYYFAHDNGSSVLFLRGLDDAYTSLLLPAGEVAPTAPLPTDEGFKSYCKESSDGEKDTLTLQ